LSTSLPHDRELRPDACGRAVRLESDPRNSDETGTSISPISPDAYVGVPVTADHLHDPLALEEPDRGTAHARRGTGSCDQPLTSEEQNTVSALTGYLRQRGSREDVEELNYRTFAILAAQIRGKDRKPCRAGADRAAYALADIGVPVELIARWLTRFVRENRLLVNWEPSARQTPQVMHVGTSIYQHLVDPASEKLSLAAVTLVLRTLADSMFDLGLDEIKADDLSIVTHAVEEMSP
jgi:hypothetical protein